MSDSVYQVVTERIVSELEKGVVPWQLPWVSGAPRSVVTGDAYRGFNALILGMCGQDHSTPFWTTFNQAKEMGGSVRKGAKSVPITFWKEIEPDSDGADSGENKDRPRLMCRYYRVFNASQIEWTKGEPKRLREWREKLAERGGATEPVQAAENLVAEMMDAPKIVHQGLVAHYTPATDVVQIPPRENFSSVPGYYATLFHELTHATGHPKRLNRFEVGAKPSLEKYSKEELVAELGACFLCQQAGVTPDYPQSAAYIADWSRVIKADPRIILSAAAAAQRSTEHVLGISPERARAREKSPDQEIVTSLQAEVAGHEGQLAGRNQGELALARGAQRQRSR